MVGTFIVNPNSYITYLNELTQLNSWLPWLNKSKTKIISNSRQKSDEIHQIVMQINPTLNVSWPYSTFLSSLQYSRTTTS